MIHTDRAIVVEGKYDKIKLSSMVDGVIICTGGFRVYKDKEMQTMLRRRIGYAWRQFRHYRPQYRRLPG